MSALSVLAFDFRFVPRRYASLCKQVGLALEVERVVEQRMSGQA